MADGDYTGVSFDKILEVDLLGSLYDLGLSVVTELTVKLCDLVLDDLLDFVLIGKDAAKLVNYYSKLCESFLNLLSFKT